MQDLATCVRRTGRPRRSGSPLGTATPIGVTQDGPRTSTLPMIAPVVHLVWLHAMETQSDLIGRCCEPEVEAWGRPARSRRAGGATCRPVLLCTVRWGGTMEEDQEPA